MAKWIACFWSNFTNSVQSVDLKKLGIFISQDNLQYLQKWSSFWDFASSWSLFYQNDIKFLSLASISLSKVDDFSENSLFFSKKLTESLSSKKIMLGYENWFPAFDVCWSNLNIQLYFVQIQEKIATFRPLLWSYLHQSSIKVQKFIP